MRVVGIDPGIHGAFALVDDGILVAVEDMPVIPEIVSKKVRNKPNPALMADILRRWEASGPLIIYIEKVGPTPKDGVVGAFSFGKGAGLLEGVAAGMGLPFTLVTPQTWKKAMGAPADKNAARARACQLFPSHAAQFARVKDDGRAESALLALYGYRQMISEMMG